MECPEYHTENPESRKYCRACGKKLLLICPDCCAENKTAVMNLPEIELYKHMDMLKDLELVYL